jgi:hypothetical protein
MRPIQKTAREAKLNVGVNRRGWMHSMGLGALGIGFPPLLQAAGISDQRRPPLFGNARSCIVVFLFGGPGQQDLWDLKPDAPVELRGEYLPISTSVPGIQISDHLPQLSRQADKYTIVRSVSHTDFEHGSASYTALTGHPHPLPGTNTPARKEDFPTYGAVVARLKPTDRPVPSAAVLGPVMHQGNRPPMAGQNAGFLGEAFEPYRIDGDPNAEDFRVAGLDVPPELVGGRLGKRFELLEMLDGQKPSLLSQGRVDGMSKLKQRAFGLLQSSTSQQAFELEQEKTATRDRYGRHKFGQTLILARRLVEAQVPLVTVNWSKLNADQWDTHKNNYKTLGEKLLPPFDQGMSALLEDLDQRGLLDSTLVVCLGEFGRTPKINKDAGRDHWPDCYSVLMAGGGIPRGFVLGTSDRHAAYPLYDPVGPWDIAATMYHLLGVDPHVHVRDRENRPFLLSPGRVIEDLVKG